MSSKSLISGFFDEQHVTIRFEHKNYTRNKDALEYIKKQWNKIVQEKPSMFAGDLVRVVKSNSDSEHIRLYTIHTTYDDFYVTQTKSFQEKFPNELISNPLSVGCILVTNDNYLVLGIRNKQVAVEPGKITVVSGMVDDKDIVDFKKVDLFSCINREIEEEIGVKPKEISDLLCIGLVDSKYGQNTHVPFFGRTNLHFNEILQRENDGEFSEIIKLGNSEIEISAILNNNNNLSDILVPTLQIYLKLFSSLNTT